MKSRSTRWVTVIFAALTISASGADDSRSVCAFFRPGQTEVRWLLPQLNPQLPADWTPYGFLVLEFKASSSQRFDLGLETSAGHFAKRIGPFAGVWVRAS